jgi:hypothetical protein
VLWVATQLTQFAVIRGPYFDCIIVRFRQFRVSDDVRESLLHHEPVLRLSYTVKEPERSQTLALLYGKAGKELSSSSIGRNFTIIYKWENEDSSNLNATFQNDKLVSRAQFGLK